MRGVLLAGRFRIGELLGAGGMGQVWRALDERMRRDVAVKVVHPQYGMDEAETQARFQREVQLAGRLSHQNIVTVHDWGEVAVDGRRTLFLVMELVHGVPLHRRFKDSTPAWPRAVGWSAQIAEALHAAHSQGVVHRDIKPANVLLTPSGTVKVLDFGVAKFMGETIGARALTVTGVPLGSPPYMSPEQADGDRDIDHRSDLYSLGCLLYHAVTGRPPFTGSSQWAVLRKQMEATPAPPGSYAEGLPPPLNDLVLSLLAKRPEDRPDDAGAVHEALVTMLVDHALTSSGDDVLDLAQLGHGGSLFERHLREARARANMFLEETVAEAAARRQRLKEELAERRKAVEAEIGENVAWAEQLRARTEQQARRLLEERRAEAEQALAAARAEAEEILSRARTDAELMLKVASMRAEEATDHAGKPGTPTRPRTEYSPELEALRARAASIGARADSILPPGSRFQLVRRGYDPGQVDDHIRDLRGSRIRRRTELTALEDEFIERKLISQPLASLSEEEREAVRRTAYRRLADIFAPGLQLLAGSQSEVRPKSDVPPFDLVRKGYDRKQVDRHIGELRDEQHRLMYRIMELRRLLGPGQPREPDQH
ncbi:serine/threonine-protein kinase [Streptomyces blattellae]|uniref:serine/threonine-protein kinase n=1 Tax=Streptomyces blattellae TaxID=2569855 RepID=UPI0012B7829B|nr:serine/threonine-protein kinase [Streptomyces blattellae]